VAPAAGAAAAFGSSWLAAGLLARLERSRSFLPFGAYRITLGALNLARLAAGETNRSRLQWH